MFLPVIHLLRCLFFFEASFNFAIKAMHISGAKNELADDLLRATISHYFCSEDVQNVMRSLDNFVMWLL